MNVLEAIETRTSALKIIAPGPTPAHLERILGAATRAPDHGRLRPWRFIVLEGDALAGFGETLASAKAHADPQATERQLQAERDKAARAPTIIVVAARVQREHKVPEIEQVLAVGAGVQNMILAAHALGYGTMWKTGAPAYDARVKRELGLDAADHIVAFLFLGTPQSRAPVRAANLEGLLISGGQA